MSGYELLKQLHIVCVITSISLFVYRFSRLYRSPPRALGRLMKVLPHIIDSVLLVAALGMLWLLRLNPFEAGWLVAKITALIVYILAGALCLRAVPGSSRQLAYFLLALSSVLYIVLVALNKSALPFIGFMSG